MHAAASGGWGAIPQRWTLRIVKKTLKGDLLGKTGYKKVGAGRVRSPDDPLDAPSPEPSMGPSIKPRGQSTLTDLVPEQDDLVIISDPLHPRHGNGADLGKALPTPTPRAISPEERQAAAEAEADLAATHLGVTQSTGGRRGNVSQVKDGHAVAAPLAQPRPAPAPSTPTRGAAKPMSRAQSGPPTAPAIRAPDLGTRLEGDAVSVARMVIAEAFFRDFGASGTKMQHPRGGSFQVQPRFGDGIVRTQHDLLLPLPAGHIAPHTADLVIELEPRGILVLDVVASHVTLQDLKARAFDALQLRRVDRSFSVFVYVRCPGSGMAQGQAEAIAHGYDVHFGIDEEHVHSEAKFQALRTRIMAWLEAASAANRGAR